MPAEPAKLRRCPFCGGKPQIRRVPTSTSSIGAFFVFCPVCKTSGDNYYSEEIAAIRWNSRYNS